MQRDVRNIITTAAVNAITFSTKVTLGRSTTLSRPRCFEHSPYTSYFSTQRCLGVIKATKLSRAPRRGPKNVVGTLLL